MGREFFTKEDDYPELEETYRVWGNNYHDDGDDVECEITIRDDDGYGVYETEITSTPADGHTYRAGEVIESTMQHNTQVVVRGPVGIAIRVGDAEGSYRFARYHDGSATDTLTYRHLVEPDDFDDDGISVDAGILFSPPAPGVTQQPREAMQSLEKLLDLDFDTIASVTSHSCGTSLIRPLERLCSGMPPDLSDCGHTAPRRSAGTLPCAPA